MRHHSRLVVLCAAAAAFMLLGSNCKLTNKAPSVPTIAGPTTGVAGVPVTFQTTSTDPDGDSISVMLDWGEGSTSGWSGLVASGDTITATNTYADSGTVTVRAKAKDKSGKESDWSAGYALSLISAAPAYPDSVYGTVWMPWSSLRSGMAADGSTICVGPRDSITLFLLRTSDRAPLPSVEANSRVAAVAFSSDGRHVYVGSNEGREVLCIDLISGSVASSRQLGIMPAAIVVLPGSGRVCVVGSTKVFELEPVTLALVDSTDLGYLVCGATANRTGTRLYVATETGVGILDVDPCSLAVSNESLGLSVTPVLSHDEQLLYVTNANDSGLVVLRADDLSVIEHVNLQIRNLGDIDVSPDGTHLYVDMPYGIYVFDTRTMAPVDSIALDDMWGDILIHPGGDSLYYVGYRTLYIIGKRQ